MRNTEYKVLPFHAMRAYGGVEVWIHFNLGPNASSHLHAIVTLLAGKESLVPHEQEAGFSAEPQWMFW